jgi:hypothetical protein
LVVRRVDPGFLRKGRVHQFPLAQPTTHIGRVNMKYGKAGASASCICTHDVISRKKLHAYKSLAYTSRMSAWMAASLYMTIPFDPPSSAPPYEPHLPLADLDPSVIFISDKAFAVG